MTRLAITTIVRYAPLEEPAGFLRVIDLETGAQAAMAPLPDAVHRARDTNPRGGLRGGRGIGSAGNALAVAVNDRILILGPDWRPRQLLSHPWMGGIHDIAADEAGLWVTCADNDLLLRIGWDGELLDHWHWRADRRARRALGFGWLPKFPSSIDHRDPRAPGLRIELGHVNAVALDGDTVLVGLGLVRAPVRLLPTVLRTRAGRIARRVGLGGIAERALPRPRPPRGITPGELRGDVSLPDPPGWSWAVAELRTDGAARMRSRIVARHPAGAVPAHNVAVADGLLAVNDSAHGRVVGLDRETGAIARSVELPGELPFPRGLAALPDGRCVVGTQLPAALTVVDLGAERIDDRIDLPDDRGESPYAIAAVPDSFADPPDLPGTRSGWGIPQADASAPRQPAGAASG